MSFRLADVRIRNKLFLLLLILILVPFVLYTTIVVGQITGQMESMGFRTAELVLRQTAEFVETRADTVKRALDLMTLDATVRELTAADPKVYEEDVGLWIRDAAALRTVQDNLGQNNPDLKGFVLYMEAGIGSSTPSAQSLLYRPLAEQRALGWFQRLDGSDSAVTWFPPGTLGFEPPDDTVIRALRRIPDDNNLQATVGWARADVKVEAFETILEKAEFSEATAAFLIDKTGGVVARSRQARGMAADGLAQLAASATADWGLVRVGNLEYRTRSQTLEPTGWRLVMAIPHRDIGAFGDQARNLLLLLLATVLPCMIPLSFWAASNSTRRLESLLHGVRQLGTGRLEVSVSVDGRDEIGELTHSFNGMVVRLRQLLEEHYRLGIEVKAQELQALQAQINPHFLYNTLDLINCLALDGGQTRIVETVSALSRFYRITLSGGMETIPLARELDHARTYVEIQNLRFDQSVALVIEATDEQGEMPVLKMILQPLVENAILHGIREKPEERGVVAIRCRTVTTPIGPGLRIEVEDDGVGMNPQTVAQILVGPRRPGNEHGYGVYNIDRRLRLRYGDDAGLRYESAAGRGTLVGFTLPFIRREP